jgi:glycosyltransferase involved in cell wall biosynthesis
MPTYEKIAGSVAIASNSPHAATGYGVQVQLLVERLIRHGLHTAVISNYGLEGAIDTIKTKHGNAAHYPRGMTLYGEDVIPVWYEKHIAEKPNQKHLLMPIYDAWVYNKLKFEHPIYPWVPLDHVTLPPAVGEFLSRENVKPITMSPHGYRQLAKANIESVYIPHAVDTQIMGKTTTIEGVPTRKFMGIAEDTFLVSMVAANKANGILHRKALSEQIMAFAMFHKKYPDSHLYLHMEPAPIMGGFSVELLLQAVGLGDGTVTIADSNQLRIGYPTQTLAAIYTASDVLLAATYGEGFGVPVIEAQACGTRVITSNWAATQDLVGEDSFLVEGQPFWDEPQKAFYHIPSIGSMVEALELAYKAERGFSTASRKFALDFDVETVWEKYWLPFLRGVFDAK